MTDRPTISAALLADINESAASRLLRKLDKNPVISDSWAWSCEDPCWKIDTGSETVQITNSQVISLQQFSCSCLLSPRCFHVLAVSNSLAIADHSATPTAPQTDTVTDHDNTAEEDAGGLLTASHVHAATMMNLAVAEILGSGLRATGGSLQSRLLRAIHECRATGLHRLAAAGLRIINDARLIRRGSEELIPAQAVQSLHEAFLVAHQITAAGSSVAPQWMGTARRRYRPVASLKLFGLCCEPVLTATGYAGVVTWMLNEEGEVLSVSDVQPGTANRIPQAWKSSITLAGMALSHADLSQQRLLVSKATISDDGRVGGSDSAKAVPSKHNGWNCDAIATRFDEPLTAQIQRHFDQRDVVGSNANAGVSLMFLTGTVCGYDDTALILKIKEEIMVRLTITADTEELPYRDNLTLLSRAPGLSIRCICRLLPLQPGHFQLLSLGKTIAPETDAVQPAEDSATVVPHMQIPDGLHVDLGLETLQRSQLSSAHKQPVNANDDVPHDLRKSDDGVVGAVGILSDWLQAIAIGGRHALSRSAIKRLVQDARNLESNFQPTASRALKTLAQQAIDTQTTFEGLRFPGDSAELAQAWLSAAIVQSTTHQHLQHAAWRASVERQSDETLALTK